MICFRAHNATVTLFERFINKTRIVDYKVLGFAPKVGV